MMPAAHTGKRTSKPCARYISVSTTPRPIMMAKNATTAAASMIFMMSMTDDMRLGASFRKGVDHAQIA